MKYAAAARQKEVVLQAQAEDGGVRLCVRDFGPGVEKRHLKRLFEPFYRGESELTRSTKGTGIGLALVRELATRMGLRVQAANAEDQGFRVELLFPC